MLRSVKTSLFVTVLATYTAACSTSPTSPTAASASTPTSPASAAVSTGATTQAGGTTTAGADLQMSGSASTGSPSAGGTFSYTLQIKNAGPTSVATTSLTDTLPDGVGFLGATLNGSNAACSATLPSVSCELGPLASGSQDVVVLTVAAPQAMGSYLNVASVASSTPDVNVANNSVSISVSVKTPATDTIKVSKCYTNATATGFGEMLIKAASSDTTARLFAYRPDGSLIGEVQNGGGSRYGGTVMPMQPYDPVNVTIRSSSGGSTTVPTTPFQL